MGHCCPQLLLSSVTGGVVEDRDRSPTHRLVLLLKEKCQPRWRSWREAWSGQRSFAEALLSLASLVGTWECACVCSSGGRRHTLTHLCLALSSAFVRLFWRPLQASSASPSPWHRARQLQHAHAGCLSQKKGKFRQMAHSWVDLQPPGRTASPYNTGCVVDSYQHRHLCLGEACTQPFSARWC